MEWKLWDGEPPTFTKPEFFEAHPRIAGDHQVGYFERLGLVAGCVVQTRNAYNFETLTDLGCGDGTLLTQLFQRMPFVKMWGYELGRQNVAHAQSEGLDVRRASIYDPDIELGECVLLTEVLEHLVRPHKLLLDLYDNPAIKCLIITSPAGENAEWHYEHHAWAWDLVGFDAMIREAGWNPIIHETVMAHAFTSFPPSNTPKRPTFQCIVGVKQ